jgi:hypothetical protein
MAVVIWLLLLHQVPPTPAYLRAKILRRLKQIGALALKNSAYLLPDSEEAAEDFQWLLTEIRADGGDGWVLRTEMVAGLTDDSIKESFREMRAADYRQLLADAQSADLGLRKIRKRFDEVARIDFFDAPGKQEALNLMEDMERASHPPGAASAPAAEFQGRRWVTRRGIKVDRTACCWLIVRFIDANAEISFVDPSQYKHREGEIRFDMFEGEITHEGDRCSFEMLVERCDLRAPALSAVAEIVHDLDLKDGKFGRPETAGVAAMIEGLALRHQDDPQRMKEGLVIFDSLYARLRSGAQS